MEIILITIVLAYLTFREVSAVKERKDMLDRLMSKGLGEYKDNLELEENQFEEESKETIDIVKAKEEINAE